MSESKGLHQTEVEVILNKATCESLKLEGQLLPTAARHGDFTPRNILCDKQDCIRVFDFEHFGECIPIYEDVSSFIAYLALMRGQPYYSQDALEIMINGFLIGYGDILGSELLSLYSLKSAVTLFRFNDVSGPILKRVGLLSLLRIQLLKLAMGGTRGTPWAEHLPKL